VDGDGRFFYPWGGEVARVPPLAHGDVTALPRDVEACASGTGERLDLALAVDAVLAIERRARAPAVT
jgi:hypothetical protein